VKGQPCIEIMRNTQTPNVYSPELTPVELIFNKMKTLLHRYEHRDHLRFNIDVAIYRVLQEISVSDLHGFYGQVGYFNI